MQIVIGGCTIEREQAEMLTAPDAPELVYMVDELDERIFLTPEQAMDYGEENGEGWVGDMCVSEYRNNLRFDEEKGEYYLEKWDAAPLDFTGRFWTKNDGGHEWVEE